MNLDLRRLKMTGVVVRVLNSFYVRGIVGWWILYRNYPFTDVLPKYAG